VGELSLGARAEAAQGGQQRKRQGAAREQQGAPQQRSAGDAGSLDASIE
jgi:hypothetical protein